MNQVITFSFFKYEALKHKYWAFKMMQLMHSKFKKVEHLSFYKIMGTGGGDGFQWYPDFSTYTLLCVWDNQKAADDFLAESAIYKEFKTHSIEHINYWLYNIEAHGFWSKQQPFVKQNMQEGLPIAILTRARIKWKNMLQFWSYVPNVSGSMSNYPGLIFGKGVGEWPLIQQATFSIWESLEHMKAYAYQNQKHKEVIHKTRELGWYKEEMFARFQVFKVSGSWNGNEPLKNYLPTTKV